MSKTMTTGEYKGHKLLVFGPEQQYPFQFGAGKAKLLLAAIDEVGPQEFHELLKKFVAENGNGGVSA